jgi:hypothetical protein
MMKSLAIAFGLLLCSICAHAQAMPGPWAEIMAITPSSTTAYTDSSVADGANYVYAVTAYSAANGESPIEERRCVSIPSTGAHSVALTWNWDQGSGGAADGFFVYRWQCAGCGALGQSAPAAMI